MRRWLTEVLLGGAVTVFAVLVATPAAAVDATGCSGAAASTSKDGGALDAVQAPGEGGTSADPFLIDQEGTVEWNGATEATIRNGTWSVKAWPVSLSGTMDNGEGLTSKAGSFEVKKYVPFRVPGLVRATVELHGDGGSCVVSGWVRMTGGAAFTPVWFAGALSGALGVGGLASLLARFFGAGVRP